MAHCTVVVFPANPDLRDQLRTFVHGVQPNQHGQFRVEGLPPADYLAIAATGLRENAWADPEVLNRLWSDATPFRIDEGEQEMLPHPSRTTHASPGVSPGRGRGATRRPDSGDHRRGARRARNGLPDVGRHYPRSRDPPPTVRSSGFLPARRTCLLCLQTPSSRPMSQTAPSRLSSSGPWLADSGDGACRDTTVPAHTWPSTWE